MQYGAVKMADLIRPCDVIWRNMPSCGAGQRLSIKREISYYCYNNRQTFVTGPAMISTALLLYVTHVNWVQSDRVVLT